MSKTIGRIVIAIIILCIILLIFSYLYAHNMLPDVVYEWVQSNEKIHALVDKLIEHHIWDTIIENVKEDVNLFTDTAE